MSKSSTSNASEEDFDVGGVSDGDRTRDNRDHNPVLYQLSYTHHGPDGAGAEVDTNRSPAPQPNRLGQDPASRSLATAVTSSELGPGGETKAVRR